MNRSEADPQRSERSIFSNTWNMNDGVESMELAPNTISVPAILSLVGAVFSCLVFLSPSFYFFPIISLLLALYALYSIKKSGGHIIGRPLSLVAVGLLLIPSVALPVMNQVYKTRLTEDAKNYFQLWFDFAKKGNIKRILELKHSAHIARSLHNDEQFWQQFLGEEESHMSMHRELSNPLLLTLATLGDQAEVRYYKTDRIVIEPEKDSVVFIYAVTYPNAEGKKETFFMQVDANRTRDDKYNIGIWRGGERAKGPLPLDDNGEPFCKER